LKKLRISFNSIVPAESPVHLLAFRQLKSYLDFQGAGSSLDISFNLFLADQHPRDMARHIRDQGPDMAAFSVYTWNAVCIRTVCGMLKEEIPGVSAVLGGPYATGMARELMADGSVDFIVKGAGEAVFHRFLEEYGAGGSRFENVPGLLYRRNGEVFENAEDGVFDVGVQDYPLDVKEGDSELFYYETSRGCPFKCRYCSWSTSERVIRFYPREKIRRDLEAIFELRHVKYLGLCDSDLFINREHGLWVTGCINRLNRERKRKGWPEVNLSLEINPEFLDDEIIDALLELPMGANIVSFGLQTVDEKVHRDHLDRRFHKEAYTRNIKRLYEKAARKGLGEKVGRTTFVEIIHGLPGDSYQGFRRTVDYIFSELGMTNFISYRFQLLPGSYFWDHARDYDLVCREEPPYLLVSSDTFSEDDLERAERLVFFMYLFSRVFRAIANYVGRNVAEGRLEVYEKIIDHLSRSYPEVMAELAKHYHPSHEDEAIIRMLKYRTDKDFMELKYKIVREAREIVKEHLRQAGKSENGGPRPRSRREP